MEPRGFLLGAGMIIAGVMGGAVEQYVLEIIVSSNLAVTGGPFSGAINTLLQLPELSVIGGVLVTVASLLVDSGV